MELKLSPRLQACCQLIRPGDRVADVCCDHGYLGIYLLLENIASQVYAGDINQAPLLSAVENAKRYGVSERLECFLSDGLQKLPKTFDTLVCAGIGADTIISILSQAPWLKSSQYRLVLQCQSKTHALRSYLSEQGFAIDLETVISDSGFLYTVMSVTYRPGETLTPGGCYFPPALLKSPSRELSKYYQQVITRLTRAVEGQKEHASPMLLQALTELTNDPALAFLKE